MAGQTQTRQGHDRWAWQDSDLQSATTIWERFSSSANAAGEVISTVFDMVGDGRVPGAALFGDRKEFKGVPRDEEDGSSWQATES